MSTTVISSGGSLDLTSPLSATFNPSDAVSFAGTGDTLSLETSALELETLGNGTTVEGFGGVATGFTAGDKAVIHNLNANVAAWFSDSSSTDDTTLSQLFGYIPLIDSTYGPEVVTVAPGGVVTDNNGFTSGLVFGQTGPAWLGPDFVQFGKNVEESLFGDASQTSTLYITLAPDSSNTSVVAATITSSGPMAAEAPSAPPAVGTIIPSGGSIDLTAPLSATYSPANYVSFAGTGDTLSVETSALELETLSGGNTVLGVGGLDYGFTATDKEVLHNLNANVAAWFSDSSSTDDTTLSQLFGYIPLIDSTYGPEVVTVAPGGVVTDNNGFTSGLVFGQTGPAWLGPDFVQFGKNVEESLFGDGPQTSTLYITLAPDSSNTSVVAATVTSSGPMQVVVCYLRGTNILTPTGERRIEDLREGDLVATHSGGFQPIKWIGVQSFGARFVAKNHDRLPVKISAGALGDGLPVRDLFVSPGHSVLLDGQLILARDLVNGITITQPERAEDSHYYLLELDTHDCIVAEGAWAESYADGPGLRNQFHNVSEYLARFPDYVEPEHLMELYAPRPQVGPDLEARLATVLARTGYQPGALTGYVERAGDVVEGWACDSANPYYPVEVAIYAGEEELGRTLAHQYREDLLAAGFGAGRCMFSFALPADLSDAARAQLRVVCVADGTVLACASEIAIAA